MANALSNTFRLARAGIVLAQHGVRFVPKGMAVPLPLAPRPRRNASGPHSHRAPPLG